MMVLENKNKLSLELSRNFDTASEISNLKPVEGGCINETFEFTFDGIKYFLKENSESEFPGMFKNESKGLTELRKCNALAVPKPILEISIDSRQYLVLEYLERAPANTVYFERLGAGLAELHRNKGTEFGFEEDNYMGSIQQSNTKCNTWEDFFSMHRLQPLVKWCYDKKALDKKHLSSFENLYQKLNEIFPDEPASLLHGDLWSGNVMNTNKGPSVYDPAVYYGHREMDMAMTRLFGGFENGFYEFYNHIYPLEKKYKQRTDICNLYPLLVHVRLFGNGYLHEVLQTIKRF